ncbi:MAG: class II aldolase/adducin family protein [Acidaminococcaceae bacterium]|nr:class II aldolase/adducin family protein [Acidaminococcaceae bacterium]
MDKGNSENIRQSVVEAGLVLAHSSMTIGTYGNISCRVDENHIAITPSGRDYEQLTSADIVVTDLEGTVQIPDSKDGDQEKSVGNPIKNHAVPLRPSSELPLHLEIYKNFPEARAIVHTHSVYASALAVAHKDLPPVIEDLTQIVGGAVRCTEYTIAGTKELGQRVVEAMEGGRSAALIANHGAVCWGRTMKEALATAKVLEKAAQIYCIAHTFGTPFPLDGKTVNALHGFYVNHYSKRQRGEE